LSYGVKICVKEVKDKCAMGYRVDDCFMIEKYYIRGLEGGSVDMRSHQYSCC